MRVMGDNRGIPEAQIERLNTPHERRLRRRRHATEGRARRLAEARRRVAKRDTG